MYYILAEQFDENPFLIFAWRGRTQQELLDGLRARRSMARTDRSDATPIRSPAQAADAPIPLEVGGFWANGPELAEDSVSPLASETPDLLLRELGPLPVESSSTDAAALLAAAYATIAHAAERRALR